MTAQFEPSIGREIFDLRPDYCAISVIAEGVDNAAAYDASASHLQNCPAWADGHLEAWRETYRAFGAKPQRTPCSAEALLSRLRKDGGLPAINAVVDLYNWVSVRHALPVGGENIAAYVGSPRLIRAAGAELFDTTKDGAPFLEAVPPGEVVWADDRGVTCRRWNWRQGNRTRIDLDTHRMWFVLERLEPMPIAAAEQAVTALVLGLRQLSPRAQIRAQRIDRTGSTEISP
ncbi:MAG TPA: phenylalanine--tRNA ligase beta subunit-related protein [Steroidobacteraceae bacterium]|jgi:DNA/RNA-binding domain of Phe-tRNA-synthetase-like protein